MESNSAFILLYRNAFFILVSCGFLVYRLVFIQVLFGGYFFVWNFVSQYCVSITKKEKLERLETLLQSLPEQYLAGEVLPPPSSGVERYYYEVMKSVSRSAINAAETAKQEKRNIWSMWSSGFMR